MPILASRATKRPAQGGAGSKRCVLGCDPGAGQESAGNCAFLTRAFTVASPETGAPAPRSGALTILAATPWVWRGFGSRLLRAPFMVLFPV